MMTTYLVAIVLAAVGALAGGALSGIVLGGKDLGNQLAATMGAFYGPIAGLLGVIAGIVIFRVVF